MSVLLTAEQVSAVLEIIEKTYKDGAESALIEAGLAKEHYSERQMFKRYGKARVRRWEGLKLVIPIYTRANTSTKLYSKKEAAKASTLDIILPYPVSHYPL